MSLEKAFREIGGLVSDFAAHERKFLNAEYQEQELRIDFIDKFFGALGWDVRHELHKDPYRQEVKVERNVGVEGRQKKADYSFSLAPQYTTPKFFVEAKKPYVSLESADNYFQIMLYSWNSEVPIGVLFNFAQLQLVDCRYKPNIDTALHFGIPTHKFTYHDYANKEKFALIYWLLSREAVVAGGLDRFAETLPKKKGKGVQGLLFKTAARTLDETFLNELESIRLQLAKAYKRCDEGLDGHTLTEMVTRTIDRLVFIRFLEDKLIEAHPIMANFGRQGRPWHDFIAAGRKLDKVYNGVVFKKHSVLDDPSFQPDDEVFGTICNSLSSKDSPFAFNYIPIHILGSIYERFLGSVIRASEKRASVDEKPEVRKAGGVYYTPKYIVDYIVEATLSTLVAGKTPAQLAKLRIADISCGSGSFLLGVFDYLLREHSIYYNANPAAARAAGCLKGADDKWHLTIGQKRAILVQNIFGMDKDAQAVEVAQLSLYLKLLEDETTASARAYSQLDLREANTLLPSLARNVLCGNSLIEPDAMALFTDATLEIELVPTDIRARFPSIFENGGFDAIVGNPPYVRPKNITAFEKEYFWAHYKTFTHKSDLYCCFIERAIPLLTAEGRLGYIVSEGWLRLNSFQELRKLLLSTTKILELVILPYKVFENANVSTGILVVERRQRKTNQKIRIIEGAMTETGPIFKELSKIPQKSFEETFQNVFDVSISPASEEIKEKFREGPTIGEYYSVSFGLKTGDDSKFLHHMKGLHREDKKLLRGEDVKRYGSDWKGEYVWYVPDQMKTHRATARPGDPERFEQPKVLVKDTSKDFAGTYDDSNFYVKDVLIVLPKREDAPDLRFLTALINSNALKWYYRSTFKTIHVQNEELASLPLPKLNLKLANEKNVHDSIVRLVSQMLEAVEKAATARTDHDRDYYGEKLKGLSVTIEDAVSTAYGLSMEDRKYIQDQISR